MLEASCSMEWSLQIKRCCFPEEVSIFRCDPSARAMDAGGASVERYRSIKRNDALSLGRYAADRPAYTIVPRFVLSSEFNSGVRRGTFQVSSAVGSHHARRAVCHERAGQARRLLRDGWPYRGGGSARAAARIRRFRADRAGRRPAAVVGLQGSLRVAGDGGVLLGHGDVLSPQLRRSEPDDSLPEERDDGWRPLADCLLRRRRVQPGRALRTGKRICAVFGRELSSGTAVSLVATPSVSSSDPSGAR